MHDCLLLCYPKLYVLIIVGTAQLHIHPLLIMSHITACQIETLGKSVSLSNHTDSICQHSSTGSVIIPHGVACYNGTISGSILTYHCDDGFTIDNVENQNLTCLSDGNWSGEVPECLAKGNHVCDILCYKSEYYNIAIKIIILLLHGTLWH